MTTIAIKIILILCVMLNFSVSARYIDSRDENDTIHDITSAVFVEGYCYEEGEHKHEYVPRRNNLYEGVTVIEKEIVHNKGKHSFNRDAYMNENISTVYDKKDSIIFFRHYIWKYDKLIQTTDDDITKTITQRETPCDLAITESSGDTIFLNLDPKEKIKGSVKRCSDLILPAPKHYKCGKYDAIINAWLPLCQKYYEKNKSLNDSVSLNAEKYDSYFLSYIFIIILILIIVLIFAVIYKNFKRENPVKGESNLFK